MAGFLAGFLVIKKVFTQKQTATPALPKTAEEEKIDPSVKVNENEKASDLITPVSKDMVNILFLGKGGAGHEGGGLTDSITLASFNYAKKEINLIAIPRDLWYNGRKINSVFATSAETLKNDVGQITGLKTDYYLAVDFANLVSGIDLLGGIDVDNPKTWTDNFYPVKGKEQDLCGFSPEKNAEVNQKYTGFQLEKQFTCRYEQLHFEKGTVHLDGTTALKYLRSRHSAEYGSDFARGEKAQAVLIAIGRKLIAQNLTDSKNPAFKKLVASVTSNLTLAKVPEIIKILVEASQYKIIHTNLSDQNVLVGGTGPGGAYILVPKAGNQDFAEVRNFIQHQ